MDKSKPASPQGVTSKSHVSRILPPARLWFTRIKTPGCTSTSIVLYLLWEISLCTDGVDYVDPVWHRLLEQSECQNVTNLAEPSVPRPPLSIPTSTPKRHRRRCSDGGYGRFNNNMGSVCSSYKLCQVEFTFSGRWLHFPKSCWCSVCWSNSHETWWEVYVWEWDWPPPPSPRGSWHRPSTEMSPVQTPEGVNGDVLWHTGTDVWAQACQVRGRDSSSLVTGVNYGTKGFAKIIYFHKAQKAVAGREDSVVFMI